MNGYRGFLLVSAVAVVMLFGAGPAGADGPTVPIRDLAFPPEVAILAGETVIWTNEEPVIPHDVVSGVPGRADVRQLFASPYLRPGEAFSFTFEAPGTYEYFCSLHPNMRGAVVVTEGSSAASARLASSLAGQSADATVVASGLLNPRGFTFAPDGALIVVELTAVPFPQGAGRILRIDLASRS